MEKLQLNLIQRFEIIDDTISEKVKTAKDLATGQTVCIKVWHKDDSIGVNEVKVLSTLSHLSIPHFICSFEEGDNRYLVSEWVEAVTLEQFICEKGSLTQAECIDIALKLCDVLNYMHSHIEGPYAYVDLKPSNILVDADKKKLYLIDFEAVYHVTVTAENIDSYITKVLGTEIYSAPEVIYGKPCVLSDVYSIGAVLLYILTGNPPVNRKRLNEFGQLGKLIEKCMRFEIEDRLQSVDNVIDELNEIKNQEKQLTVKVENIKAVKKYKSIVITVDGNMSFACELAYVASNSFNYKTAIFELTESNNIITYYLSQDNNSSFVCENDLFSINYGMKTYLSRSSREWIKRGLLRNVRDMENLYVSRSNIFEDLDISDVKDVRSFKCWANNNFDIVIVAAEERLYSARKSAFMLNSDYVIAAPRSNVDDIQLTAGYYNRLSRQGYISSECVRYVAWDYIDKVSLPESGISMLVGSNKYLGSIPFDQRRLMSRNVKGSCYAGDALQEITSSYYSVIGKLMTSTGGE